MSAKNTFTHVEGTSLIMERTFDAPRELVFSMYVDPDHISRWWGPTGWDTHTYEMNVKPGGVWHYCMRSSENGQGAWGKATYQEIDPPNRLVYIDAFSDEYGNDAPGMPTSRIVTDFFAEKSGTRISSRTTFETEEELQKVLDMQVVEGMAETFDRLGEYLAGRQKLNKNQ